MVSKVIVTGCSGFLGQHLVRRLIDEKYEVVGISRSNPHITGMKHVSLDLTKENVPYLGGAYSVVHAAGLTREGKSAELTKVNVEGTRNALQLSGGRFIHLSSSSIYDLTSGSLFTGENESTKTYRFYNEYSRTKHEADTLVLSNELRDIKPIVLRPHAIYGPGDTTLFPRLQKRIRNNTLTLPEAGNVLHNLTHVDNLITAILLSLKAPQDVHGAFNVTDNDAVVLSEAMRKLTGSNLTIKDLPLFLALHLSKFSEKITRQGSEPKFSEYSVRQIGMDRTYDISKAKEELNYKPTRNQLVESYSTV